MLWNQTRASWEAVESYMNQDGYLVCNTDHFSLWTVAELGDTNEASDDTTLSGIPAEYVYIGAVAVVVVVVLVGLFAYKKRK
jgi:hypothetical protein